MMEEKCLYIGRWTVCFIFALDGYDEERILNILSEAGGNDAVLEQASELMSSRKLNTAFTYTNVDYMIAIIAIGPVSSRDEFIDSLIHEIHHLAVAIASNVGVDLEGEAPAYLSGDLARDMAEYICNLGCRLV